MSSARFLAFDLGAESGRAVAATLDGGRLVLDEVHRFANDPVSVRGVLYWDVLALYANMLAAMRNYARRYGDSVDGIGIDTWGVDFGLLAADGGLLANPVCYRDDRTESILPRVEAVRSREDLFAITGMSLSRIQSLCQLLAMRRSGSPVLAHAATLLMMPDLLAYFLTGEQYCERTNAVNTQLYDLRRGEWWEDGFRDFDLPRTIMPPLIDPGTRIGRLSESVARQAGLARAPVIAPCTHDTGSAVAAVPAEGTDWAFLSCGTWSVVGALTATPLCSAFRDGVCNELTLGSAFLCRNLMGLWILQEVRRQWQREGRAYSYDEITSLAREAPHASAVIDPDDPRFLAPANMTAAIEEYCCETGQRPPRGPGRIARCILDSLALSYRRALEEIARLTQRSFGVCHIVGGGSRNALLCQLTANALGIPVVAGPAEATVSGNALVQALARGYVDSADAIRRIVRCSTPLAEYKPVER